MLILSGDRLIVRLIAKSINRSINLSIRQSNTRLIGS